LIFTAEDLEKAIHSLPGTLARQVFLLIEVEGSQTIRK